MHDVAVDEVHHVEGHAEHGLVLTHGADPRQADPVRGKGELQPGLADHVVRRGRKRWSRGAAENETRAVPFEQVGEVRAATFADAPGRDGPAPRPCESRNRSTDSSTSSGCSEAAAASATVSTMCSRPLAMRLPCHDPTVARTHADGREIVEVADRAAWRAWLAAHHEQPVGIWLAMPRKGSSLAAPTYDQAVEEALCYGWIDSTANTLDDEVSLLYFARRKRGSTWARTNKERLERLERDGLIALPGRTVIERAKEDGSWTALDGVEALEVPDDLAAALAANPTAAAYFDAFPPGAKKQILWWVVSAKRPETRTKRVAETVPPAEQNVRANQ